MHCKSAQPRTTSVRPGPILLFIQLLQQRGQVLKSKWVWKKLEIDTLFSGNISEADQRTSSVVAFTVRKFLQHPVPSKVKLAHQVRDHNCRVVHTEDCPSSNRGVIPTMSSPVNSKNVGNRTGNYVSEEPWNDCCVMCHPSLLPAKSQWFSVWCPLRSHLHCLQCWLACLGECLAVCQGYWWEIQTLCSAPFGSSSLLPHGWSSWRCSLCIKQNHRHIS